MATKKPVRHKESADEWIARAIFFTILGFSVYWGSLLSLFAFGRIFVSLQFSDVVFGLIYVLLGIFAWLNLFFYIDIAKKERFTDRWIKWYKKDRDVILMTGVLFIAYEVILLLFINNYIAFQPLFGAIFHVLSLPTIFAEFLMAIVRTGTDQALPALSFINELDIFVAVAFQLILFYYISKLLFWAPHYHRQHNKKK